MASFIYTNPPGFGQALSDSTHYSQAVRLPGKVSAIIKTSGQGGWDPSTGHIARCDTQTEIEAQVEQAFSNVDMVLKSAGMEGGWSNVYLVRAYMVDVRDPTLHGATVASLKKWCPNHRPVLTTVGVAELALEGVRIQVAVEAYERSGDSDGMSSPSELRRERSLRRIWEM